MKKLFLQDGKLMVGEFPEEPSKPGPMSHQEFFTEYYEDDLPKYNAAVSAAKASAVECDIGLGFAKIIAVDKMEEGQLYDIPDGWTVEIEETCKWLKEQIHYPDQSDFQTEEEFFQACRKIRESDIVATGVPESDDKKDKFEVLHLGQWIEMTEDQYLRSINNNHYGRINGVEQHRKSVSPPLQESQGALFNEFYKEFEKLIRHKTDYEAIKSLSNKFTISRKP